MKAIYFLITIDVECDKSRDWSVKHPLSFNNILDALPKRLHPLFVRLNVKPTYLLSPEVINDGRCVNVFLSLDGDCELGTHLHGEYVEPDAKYFANVTSDYQADYSYSTELGKMENLTDMFQCAFGHKPTSFRSGRFGIGSNTLRILKQLGYTADSSVLPMHTIATTNHKLNFYGYPIKPYFQHVGINSYASSEEDALLEIPITVHSAFWQRLPLAGRHYLSKIRTVVEPLVNVLGCNIKPLSLRPSRYDKPTISSIIDLHIKEHCEDEFVFLNMMFHSNEIYPGCSPYTQTYDEVMQLLDRIEHAILHMQNVGANSVTMRECYRIMRQHDEQY